MSKDRFERALHDIKEAVAVLDEYTAEKLAPTPDDERTKVAKELYECEKRVGVWNNYQDKQLPDLSETTRNGYMAMADYCILREKRAVLEGVDYAITVCGLLSMPKHPLKTRRKLLEQDIARLESKQETTE